MGSLFAHLPLIGCLLIAPVISGCPEFDLSQEGMNHHDKRTGEKHGTWTTYYTNGQKSSQGTYDQGVKVEEWTYWDDAGALIKRELWREGAVLDTLEGDELSGEFDTGPTASKRAADDSDGVPKMGKAADRDISKPDTLP